MPLTNNVIIKLNEITSLVENKNMVKESEIKEIKKIFESILSSGEYYEVDEIESWLQNEGTWTNKNTRTRIINISHYIQTKFEDKLKLRMISDDDSCSCGN